MGPKTYVKVIINSQCLRTLLVHVTIDSAQCVVVRGIRAMNGLS